MLTAVAVAVVHRERPEWLTVGVADAARAAGLSPERLSRLTTRAVGPLHELVATVTRRGRPPKAPTRDDAQRELIRLRALLAVASTVLALVSLDKPQVRDAVVGAWRRLSTQLPSLTKTAFCAALSLSAHHCVHRTLCDRSHCARDCAMNFSRVVHVERCMDVRRSEVETWAEDVFGDAALGDARRTKRLVRMGARAAASPSGKLSEVFSNAKELDGAYDFVESGKVSTEVLEAAVGRSAARHSAEETRVRVAIDGSSLSLTDDVRTKGFGPIGSIAGGGHGLKVISALAVGADGVAIGLLAQTWWARSKAPRRTAKQSKRDRMRKKRKEKETGHWLATIERSAERLGAAGALGWFQLDREADAWPMLFSLAESGHWFTVRSAWDRLLAETGRDKQYLRARMATITPLGSYELDVPARPGRQARRARMVIHAAEVTLLLREKMNGKKPRPLRVHVVWTHEEGTTPPGETPIDWMLLTNAPIDSLEAAQAVVAGYAMRWRIEEFHRTWKTGACNVEQTQLRSRNAVIRWATILGVVATRIERLKRLARKQPERPASEELSPIELEVLIALKRRTKKRTEDVPDGVPTIAQATRWIADLGGYTGKSSGGPPGAITIGRGLERLHYAVQGARALKDAAQ